MDSAPTFDAERLDEALRRLDEDVKKKRRRALIWTLIPATFAVLLTGYAVILAQRVSSIDNQLRMKTSELSAKQAALVSLNDQIGKLRALRQGLINNLIDPLTAIDNEIKNDPNNVYLLREKGIVLSHLGRYAEARETLLSAIAKDPKNVDLVRLDLIHVDCTMKAFAAAKADAAEAIRVQPDLQGVIESDRDLATCLR
jgi:tetratricopeptide (TPR) repeat protein